MGFFKKLRRKIFAGRYCAQQSLIELKKISQTLHDMKQALEQRPAAEKDSYLSVPGWFDFPEVYTRLAGLLRDGDCCVEVGSYLGQSCAFLGQQIKARKLNCLIYAVDHWKGNPDKDDHAAHRYPPVSIFHHFILNCQRTGVLDIVRPMESSSLAAAADFNHRARFIFIDANHSYEAVCADIDAWMKKLLPDGMMAGHDYYVDGVNWPGVKKAVDEKFSKFELIGTCWMARPSDYRPGPPRAEENAAEKVGGALGKAG